MEKTIDYRDELDNPPEFTSRLIMMCDDIEQVSYPVDQAKKARLVARALPVIDAEWERYGYPNTNVSTIIQKDPSLATDFDKLCREIRKVMSHHEAVAIEKGHVNPTLSYLSARADQRDPYRNPSAPTQALLSQGPEEILHQGMSYVLCPPWKHHESSTSAHGVPALRQDRPCCQTMLDQQSSPTHPWHPVNDWTEKTRTWAQ